MGSGGSKNSNLDTEFNPNRRPSHHELTNPPPVSKGEESSVAKQDNTVARSCSLQGVQADLCKGQDRNSQGRLCGEYTDTHQRY